ncbi:LOW QUALITY PROTEIN: cytosolic 5'-nucleotidase 1A isoform X1 [Gallus gallus]|uniref:5'-nucleotidase, cytosolic IA n=1 Tax=Gallus gallus TaxID=9031 RepID=F1NE11_CHICK|nr:LOW QUALITY PROTEIN: cytosolic 5'-nucleotidase 1A isoform X1 [Gallus gallus]XP_417822.3 cytosolic 5'-nucleotidase 1A isoform X1 [Gallus gallus]|eukprot:XP_417822.3 cytosolic 5'-nucleotidase 1A isoform X1 [Gallus gallus]
MGLGAAGRGGLGPEEVKQRPGGMKPRSFMGCRIKTFRRRELPVRTERCAMEPPGTAGAPGAAGRPWDEAKAFYDNLTPKKKPKSPKPENAITIAVSSRALFRMEEEQKIYNEQGVEAYVKYQLDHENEPFLPGAAFPFVKALEAVNTQLRELYPDSEELFDIVLMTNNHAQVGVRLINSINHYDLFIERFCMTGGNSPIGYLKAYHTNLYLSSDAEKVSGAIEEGIAAATIFSPSKDLEVSEKQLRVAFDGDAVLFSDESEQIVKAHGLDMFFEHEKAHENNPLAQGPLKGFLEALGKLQKKFYSKGLRMECPIRTYLVTARSAASSGARALKTLRSWGLETDEALFLAGAPKGPLLKKIRPHIFFDDQMFHVEGAKEMGTVAAHVPYGVAQKHKRPLQEKQPQNSK